VTGTATARLAGGAGTLGVAILVANAGNYLLNLLLGRWLTPAEFSDANLMVTLMLTITSVALCLQLVAARFAGARDAGGWPGLDAPLVRRLHRSAYWAAAVVGAGLAVPAPLWRELFNTASAVPFVILGAGMPAFLVQAVGRGLMQGALRFWPLALTYVVEMVVRLGVAVPLVVAGAGVNGATAGLTASFVGTWLAVRLLTGRPGGRDGRDGPQAPAEPGAAAGVRAYLASVSVLLAGQMVVNNGDILVAKVFLAPSEAGRYAAVALVGRVVFVLSWSVTRVVFPAAARRHAAGAAAGGLLAGALGAVAGIGAVYVVGMWLAGGPVLGVVLGPEYADLSAPLAGYAVATTLFALAHLTASHALAGGRVAESWLVLAAAAGQLVLLVVLHASITQLISAQLLAMSVLVLALVLLGNRVARAPRGCGWVPAP
jgi:O-antigen/teichoic acid export membrane protein